MKPPSIIILGLCMIAAVSLSASISCAQIYKYIDENGVMHFTDSPGRAGAMLYIKERPEVKGGALGKRYDEYIRKASRENKIPFSLLKAVIKVESDFNPRALSCVGAMGLMQIMPGNFSHLKVRDPYNAYENIMGGSLYLKQLLNRFDGNLILALAAYNAGPTAVSRYNNVPPYKETRNFIKRVLKYNHIYKE